MRIRILNTVRDAHFYFRIYWPGKITIGTPAAELTTAKKLAHSSLPIPLNPIKLDNGIVPQAARSK